MPIKRFNFALGTDSDVELYRRSFAYTFTWTFDLVSGILFCFILWRKQVKNTSIVTAAFKFSIKIYIVIKTGLNLGYYWAPMFIILLAKKYVNDQQLGIIARSENCTYMWH